MELRITHLYPDKMNLYGDLGNIICLQQRCSWRDIEAKVTNVSVGDELQAGQTDLYFFGGGQDQDQLRVFEDLVQSKKQALTEDLENGVAMLAICGGYQLLGEFFLDSADHKIAGLGILPIETIAPSAEMKQRAVGNLITEILIPEIKNHYSGLTTLVGFENHSGRTRFTDRAKVNPLGQVVAGFGDNEDKQSDGAVYKNIIGSYMHGSLLPKNPHLADFLIAQALGTKQGQAVQLARLDDSAEIAAHKYILNKYA